jgi:hypothetical protein
MPTESDRPSHSAQTGGLTVRRFERHELSLPVRVTVSTESPVPVRMSRASGAADGFNASLVDLGQGGLGLESPCFLPRQAVLRVRLIPNRDGVLPEFEAEVRVMRTRMSSKEPRYALGCSFVEPDAALQQSIEDVLAAIAADRSRGAA